MQPKIALQVYTVRDELAADFAGTLRRVAEIGYAGVEFPSLYGQQPREVRAICDDLGLEIFSEMATPEALRDDLAGRIASAEILGNRHVVCVWMDAGWRNLDGYGRAVEIFRTAGRELKSRGLTLGYHNHDFEFDTLEDGRIGFDILYRSVDPELMSAELDVYWLTFAGRDPVETMKQFSGRCELLHLKDMAADEARSFTEVGTGILDMEAIVRQAVADGVKYLIVEQDSKWAGSPLESARISYENLLEITGNVAL